MIPLRISALNSLARCPGWAMLDAASDRSSSTAADSGSAVGRVAQLWHEQGEDALALQAALTQAERELPTVFPKANMQDVALWAGGYASDPRNKGVVVKNSCEATVRLTLGRFTLVGHIDQMRSVNGAERVWDIKSGKPGGREMIFSHAWQISAYALACTETYGRDILPGGILRIRSYAWNGRCKWDKDDMGTCPAFFYTPWDLDACREMMASVESHLEMLHAGTVHLHPGAQCMWCPGEAPNLCGDRISEAFEGGA